MKTKNTVIILQIVKWPLLITTELTWGKVLYGMLTLIRNAKQDLPIENTTAVFIFQPNKLSIIQATVITKYTFSP